MTTLLDLYCLAEADHVVVSAFELHKREACSVMVDGTCCIAIDPFCLRDSADEKTKLAHELGHCKTGSFYNCFSCADVRRWHENRADKWAVKKLIPEDELEAAVADGCTEAWSLAEYFGVTEDFIRKAVCWYQHGNMAADRPTLQIK